MKSKLLSALTAVTVAAMLTSATAASAAPTADDPLPVAAIAATAGDPTEPDGTVSPMIIGGSPASQRYPGLGSLQYVRGDDPHWHTCRPPVGRLSRGHQRPLRDQLPGRVGKGPVDLHDQVQLQ